MSNQVDEEPVRRTGHRYRGRDVYEVYPDAIQAGLRRLLTGGSPPRIRTRREFGTFPPDPRTGLPAYYVRVPKRKRRVDGDAAGR